MGQSPWNHARGTFLFFFRFLCSGLLSTLPCFFPFKPVLDTHSPCCFTLHTPTGYQLLHDLDVEGMLQP